MGRQSAMSTHNKLVLYKQILKPVWTYGIQLWGCAKPSNINVIQRFQNRVLKNIVGKPWYLRNADLHRDLRMDMVTAEIKRFARKHEERLRHHNNVEAIQLLDNSELMCRLKRIKTLRTSLKIPNPLAGAVNHTKTTLATRDNTATT